MATATYSPEAWASWPMSAFQGLGLYVNLLSQEDREGLSSPEKGITLEDQKRLLENYRGEIETNCSKDDTVLFSCELLALFLESEVERVKEWMDSLFEDVTIILYLRRQPEYLVSFYYTYVFGSSSWNLFDYLNMPEDRSILAYHQMVKRWSIFGKDKLKIRIFDKQEFHDKDLLADFAHTVGFNMTDMQRVENVNVSIGSANTEFLRLLNPHYPMLDSWTHNSDYWQLMGSISAISEKTRTPYHVTCEEVRQILAQYREGNDWIAREYLGREKLFSEDVSMYPETVDSPHGLTLEKCAEITAHLWKERCEVIRQLQQGNQQLQSEVQHRDAEIQRSHDNLALLQQKRSIYWHYYRYKVLAKITLGKKCKHYKEKRNAFHEKVRQIRELYQLK